MTEPPDPSTWSRWPLLGAVAALVATAVGVDVSTGPGTGLALACMGLAATFTGAAIYAEGVRVLRRRRGDDVDP